MALITSAFEYKPVRYPGANTVPISFVLVASYIFIQTNITSVHIMMGPPKLGDSQIQKYVLESARMVMDQ